MCRRLEMLWCIPVAFRPDSGFAASCSTITTAVRSRRPTVSPTTWDSRGLATDGGGDAIGVIVQRRILRQPRLMAPVGVHHLDLAVAVPVTVERDLGALVRGLLQTWSYSKRPSELRKGTAARGTVFHTSASSAECDSNPLQKPTPLARARRSSRVMVVQVAAQRRQVPGYELDPDLLLTLA
jgi:hypothetical protein